VTDTAEWERPIPTLDGVSKTYWEAGARGELLFQQCPACGNRQLYPRAMCTACGETPEWVRASGRPARTPPARSGRRPWSCSRASG